MYKKSLPDGKGFLTFCHSLVQEAPLKPLPSLNPRPGPPVTFMANVHVDTYHPLFTFSCSPHHKELFSHKSRHSVHTLCPSHYSKQAPLSHPQACRHMHQEHGLYWGRLCLTQKPTCAGPGRSLGHPRKGSPVPLRCSRLLRCGVCKLCGSVPVTPWILSPRQEMGPWEEPPYAQVSSHRLKCLDMSVTASTFPY